MGRIKCYALAGHVREDVMCCSWVQYLDRNEDRRKCVMYRLQLGVFLSERRSQSHTITCMSEGCYVCTGLGSKDVCPY